MSYQVPKDMVQNVGLCQNTGLEDGREVCLCGSFCFHILRNLCRVDIMLT